MAPADSALPLHAKAVPAMKLSAFLAAAPRELSGRIVSLLASATIAAPRAKKRGGMRIPAADAAVLLEAGYITPFTASPLKTSIDAEYFSVIEEEKGRRRPIIWPAGFLERSTYRSRFTLRSVPEYAALVHHGTHAVAFDLASSFAQVPLSPNTNIVLSGLDGTRWRVERLPYGIDFAPEVMQLICCQLADWASAACGHRPTTAVHIDNVAAVGNLAAVTAWAAAFVGICAEYGVTLNTEAGNVPASVFSFAGITFDLVEKTVRVRRRLLFPVPDDLPTMTLEDFERVMGRAIFAAAVLRRSFLPIYFVLKWWRRRLSQLAQGRIPWATHCALPPGLRRALVDWLEPLRANAPVVVPPPQQKPNSDDLVLAVDATLTGWGAVLLERGAIPSAVGGNFAHHPATINDAELLAALAGVRAFSARLRDRGVVLLSDNTTTTTALEKGPLRVHRTFAAGLVTTELEQLLDQLKCVVRVGRVETGDNVADAVSRGKPLLASKINPTLEAGRQTCAGASPIKTCAGAGGGTAPT